MQFTTTIPDAVAPRVLDAVAAMNGYQDQIDGQPNPETKGQFARRMHREWLKNQVVEHEGNLAGIQASEDYQAAAEIYSGAIDSARTKAETEIAIT